MKRFRAWRVVCAALLLVLALGVTAAVHPAEAGSNGQQLKVALSGGYWFRQLDVWGYNQSGQWTHWWRAYTIRPVSVAISNYWWVGRVEIDMIVEHRYNGISAYACYVTVPKQSGSDWTVVTYNPSTNSCSVQNGSNCSCSQDW